jgi:hypothetical protein
MTASGRKEEWLDALSTIPEYEIQQHNNMPRRFLARHQGPRPHLLLVHYKQKFPEIGGSIGASDLWGFHLALRHSYHDQGQASVLGQWTGCPSHVTAVPIHSLLNTSWTAQDSLRRPSKTKLYLLHFERNPRTRQAIVNLPRSHHHIMRNKFSHSVVSKVDLTNQATNCYCSRERGIITMAWQRVENDNCTAQPALPGDKKGGTAVIPVADLQAAGMTGTTAETSYHGRNQTVHGKPTTHVLSNMHQNFASSTEK